MTDKATPENAAVEHVYLKDRMRGYRGWLKIVVYTLSGIVMLSMFASNLLQSF
ncbi:hypothetical protein SAMN04488056_101269 [Cohaesibacter marisflavi]|uniref:Aa3 type cytochrome c oxidase subunit IV n=1 Tax=Cohaesibacter marisflavi TaxID=655353 RepID=A0A1I4ZXT6_9HYPH|nr:hypothetical protein [Cohaesibacter marisflavi]SFN55054.1 hypothetical protein SAMN04488056_101269 [Cohaesibacter marisflavi]